MYIFNYYRTEIAKLLEIEESNVKFWWDRNQAIDHDYVVYQTEDLNHEHKRSADYIQFLDKAAEVYDYSVNNLKWYPRSKFRPFLPNSTTTYYDAGEKEIDVLLYGGMSDRRRNIIDTISNQYKVTFIERFNSMDEHISTLRKSKYVLSVGYYDNDYNDLWRVTPALNFGANILLEPSNECWWMDFLKQYFKNRIQFI